MSKKPYDEVTNYGSPIGPVQPSNASELMKKYDYPIGPLWPEGMKSQSAEEIAYNLPATPSKTTDGTAAKGNAGGATYTVNANNQPYVNQLNALYEQIVNRKPFQYDLNGDLLYKQMADQYAQMGAKASRNAMGEAAALTGGYGNSYAEQVGAQANQQYMTALNQNIPDLYQQALNAYLAEGERMMQQYELTAAHPGMLEAISPKTYTVQQKSAEEGDDTSAYMQMLQNMLSGGINTTSAPATNALANWYYQLMNAQK